MTVIDFATCQRARRPLGRGVEICTPASRWQTWRKAELHLEFLCRLRDLAHSSRMLFEQYGEAEGLAYKDLDRDFSLLDQLRAAQAALLLTPIHRKADLETKQRLIKRASPYIPIDNAALQRALAADAAYLAIPKSKRVGASA